MRIKLIVSGQLERKALHRSLARCFPHTGAGEPVEFMQPSRFDGATSNLLGANSDSLSEHVRTFTTAMVSEALFGSEPRGGPPDLVIGVDDLELANLHQPEVVTNHIRRGVEDFLTRNPQGSRTDERRRATLRSTCSFHLLVPMPEAYFFGERAALERAGVATNIDARLCCDDLEAFETDDSSFAPAHTDHRRHPKRYLIDLLRRSGRAGPRYYRETHDGARALESLVWPQLTANPRALSFARALFEDLADALDVPNPLGDGSLASATHPSDRRHLVLRNL